MKKRNQDQELPPEPDLPPEVEAEAAGDAESEAARTELEKLREENALLKARLLETSADLDNQAKRFARERQVVRDEITVKTAREMIEVLDNFDRVLASIPKGARNDAKFGPILAILEGVEATRRLFVEKLNALGVERVDALDLPFDPLQHEAVFEEERANVAPGTVIAEVAAGWRRGAMLVRAAKVAIAKAPTAAASA